MKRRFISFITAVSLLMGLVGVLPASANYSENSATWTYTWDFAEYAADKQVTGNSQGYTIAEYEGLVIQLANTANDNISSDGVFWNGGTGDGESPRYIKYTPKSNGTLTVIAKENTSGGRVGIAENSRRVNDLKGDSSSTTETSNTTLTKACKAGSTYYIVTKAKGARISKIEYTVSPMYDDEVTYTISGLTDEEKTNINDNYVTSNPQNPYQLNDSTILHFGNKKGQIGDNGFDLYTDGSYLEFTPKATGKIYLKVKARISGTQTSTLYMSTKSSNYSAEDETKQVLRENQNDKNFITIGPYDVTAGTTYYFYNQGDRPTSIGSILYTPRQYGIKGADNSDSKTYAWYIRYADTTTVAGVEQTAENNNYANLTVSLGEGDSMDEFNGIVFSDASVDDSGSADDSKRYILVEPKYSGTYSVSTKFASGDDNGIYYADLGVGINTSEINLSDYKKGSHLQAKDDMKTTEDTVDIDMIAGHAYVIYINGSACNISEMSYQYTTDLAIDYENEKLTGFVDGGSYTIGGESVIPINNELTIAEEYFGQTIEIGGTLDGIDLTQSLEVKARPAKPTSEAITVTQPTEIDGNGTVAGITSEMEYSTDNGETWTAGDGETKEIDGGTTVLVHVKAIADTSFKSLNYEAAVKTRSAVTLNLNNGSFENDEDNVTSYLEGEEVTLPTPTRTGYTFGGWYTKESPEEGDEAAASIPANSTGALVYYAKWTPEKYTITWLDGDGSELDKQENADYDSIITVTSKTPTKSSTASENYTFSAWENFTAGTTKVTGNMTFTPSFTSSTRTYTVKWNADGNETEETLAYGAALTHTAPAKTEHTFDGWYKESTFETKLGENETVTGDITLYAKYTVIKYAINAPDTVTELKINGESASALPTAAKDATVTFKVPVAAGKKLAGDVTAAGSTLTANSEGVYSFTMPGEAVTITAVVQNKTKSGVSITPHTGVTIKVNSADSLADVMEGETVTVTAEVDERYTLTSLKWNETDIESGGSFAMPAQAVTITAETQVKPVAAITVETNPSSVQHGQNAAVTANARLWADEEKTIELTSLYPSAEVVWSLDSASSAAGSKL